MNRQNKIKLAKNLYGKYKFAREQAREYKFKILRIAHEICEVHYGGRTKKHLADIKAGKVYTLKQFALDIGMIPSSLQKWYEEYRNIVLPLEEEGLINTKKINEETALIIRNLVRTNKNRINRKTTKKELIDHYNRVMSTSKENRLLDRYIIAANTVLNFVKEHDLNKLDKTMVRDLQQIVSKTMDTFNTVSKLRRQA